MPGEGTDRSGPPLLWLQPFAQASEQFSSPYSCSQARAALDAMPEQFLTVAGRACLQRNTWYRNPWKTWAIIRCEALAQGTLVRVRYAANPATTLAILLGAGLCFATLPRGDAVLYVSTLGGVIAIIGSFGRFVARHDVAILRVAIARAVRARVDPIPSADASAR